MTSEPLPQQRRDSGLELAHVLFLDVVGYSKLLMDQQQKILNMLQDMVRKTSDFARAQEHQQLICLPTGDGMALVFFGDPEAPAHCALELSRALKSQPELKLRMGIHTGPVYRVADINANLNVAGGGINMAQRVMDCGDAGHILVSAEVGNVLGQLSSEWSDPLRDLGEAEVKHGVRIHIYNLVKEDAGNAAIPQKFCAARARVRKKRIALGAAIAGVIVALTVGVWLYHAQQVQAHTIKDKDTVVLADFDNQTGDPDFDDKLNPPLREEVLRSLNVMSEDEVGDMLNRMKVPPETKLTRNVARQVCQRANSKAYIQGTIAPYDKQYVITLEAVHCLDGQIFPGGQTSRTTKATAFDSVREAAKKLLAELGKSPNTAKSSDVPLSPVTTPSNEALKAYSFATRTQYEKGDAAAIPLYARAIELDPNFAMAYDRLGVAYGNNDETSVAEKNFRKAYGLLDQVGSHRERYSILGHYYASVTGQLDEATKQYEYWAQDYPGDSSPLNDLAQNYAYLGQYDKAATEGLRYLKLNSSSGVGYANLMGYYTGLNRFNDAQAMYKQAMARDIEDPFVHEAMYSVAFLLEDAAGMKTQEDWARGNSDREKQMLPVIAQTEAFHGRLTNARQLAKRVESAEVCGDGKECVAMERMDVALWDAEFGIPEQARNETKAALALAPARDMQVLAAVALARAGDSGGAEAKATKLAKQFPLDPFINGYWLPTIRGAIAINRKDPGKAVVILQDAAPYELGAPPPQADGVALYPIFVRGQAYLQLHQGREAAAEFQKFLDHRGVVTNCHLGALARLNLGRAYAMQGDAPKARAAYQEFFTLWEHADADIPIYRDAKTEFARLR